MMNRRPGEHIFYQSTNSYHVAHKGREHRARRFTHLPWSPGVRRSRSRHASPRGIGLLGYREGPMSKSLGAAVMFCALGVAAANAKSGPHVLQRLTMLDAKEVNAIERGEAVAVTIDAGDKTEVATLGIVRLEVPRAFYVDHVSPLAGLLVTTAKTQSGGFSQPARPEDVAALSLDPAD